MDFFQGSLPKGDDRLVVKSGSGRINDGHLPRVGRVLLQHVRQQIFCPTCEQRREIILAFLQKKSLYKFGAHRPQIYMGQSTHTCIISNSMTRWSVKYTLAFSMRKSNLPAPGFKPMTSWLASFCLLHRYLHISIQSPSNKSWKTTTARHSQTCRM